MVFDYMEHDMTGLLQRVNLTGRHYTIPQVWLGVARGGLVVFGTGNSLRPHQQGF